MNRLGVSAVMQPIFIKELGKNFRDSLSEEYLNKVYPVRSVLQSGINLSFSTDAPVVKDFSPLTGIQSALERKDEGGNVVGNDQTVSIEEALYAYTQGSAIANADEKCSGSISEEKFADFVVLNNNPLESNNLSGVKVVASYIRGEKFFLDPEQS